MKSIAIVGAGLMGRLSALSLHRLGYKVTLFDKDSKSGRNSAAYAAGGLLTPLGESLECADWIVQMGFDSLNRWPALLAQLAKPVFFEQQGSLVVAHAQDSGDMQRFRRSLISHGHAQQFQTVDSSRLQQLAPGLNPVFRDGLYLPQEGQLDNRQLMNALQHELELAKITWHYTQAIDHVEQLYWQGFELTIDCRGVGAHKQISDLRGVRGELFHLHAPEVNFTRPVRLMHPRYQLYIAPKSNHRFIVGASQIESDDDCPMTVRTALELLSAAYSVHCGFAEATISEQVSSCRPAFIDNHPQIRVSKQVIQVNGLYRHGFLVAPMILNHLLAVIERLGSAPSFNDPNYLEHFKKGLKFNQLLGLIQ